MINWDRVDELVHDFGEDDFLEIVTLFLTEVEAKLAEIAHDEAAVLAEGFHFVKGSAANLGFKALHDASAEAETSPDRSKLIEIREIFDSSKQQFEAGAKQLPRMQAHRVA